MLELLASFHDLSESPKETNLLWTTLSTEMWPAPSQFALKAIIPIRIKKISKTYTLTG